MDWGIRLFLVWSLCRFISRMFSPLVLSFLQLYLWKHISAELYKVFYIHYFETYIERFVFCHTFYCSARWSISSPFYLLILSLVVFTPVGLKDHAKHNVLVSFSWIKTINWFSLISIIYIYLSTFSEILSLSTSLLS